MSRFDSLPFPSILLAAILSTLTGCSSIMYSGLEQLGIHKRDVLVSRITKAIKTQEDTKEQFQSALEQFASVVRVDGGDLQAKYDKLNREFELAESRANAVKARNDEVEDVAKALFREWEGELKQYSDPSLRQASARQLSDTKVRYKQLMTAMRRAESRLDPVLDVFRDQMLFLKHNLNARAIGSLQGELRSVEANTASLIQEMNRSIAEAKAFIRAME